MNSVLNGRLFDHHVILSPEKKQNVWASVLTVSDVKCTLDYFACRAFARRMVMMSRIFVGTSYLFTMSALCD